MVRLNTKATPNYLLFSKTHIKYEDNNRVKGWETIYYANSNQRKFGITMLLSDKIYFRTKGITRDKEDHFIITKESVHEDLVSLLSLKHKCIQLKKHRKHEQTVL